MRSGFPGTDFGAFEGGVRYVVFTQKLWGSAHHIKKGTQGFSDVEGKLVKGFRR